MHVVALQLITVPTKKLTRGRVARNYPEPRSRRNTMSRDDREIVERLRAALGSEAALRIVSSRDAFAQRPDLLVIASSSAVPWNRVRTATTAERGLPVLVVANRWSDDDEQNALDSGAIGYLGLDQSPAVVARSMRGAIRGQVVFRRQTLGRSLRPGFLGSDRMTRLAHLTKRQQEVASLLATGAADKEIAARLGIAVATVQKHVSRLLRTVGASNRAAAVWLVLAGTHIADQ